MADVDHSKLSRSSSLRSLKKAPKKLVNKLSRSFSGLRDKLSIRAAESVADPDDILMDTTTDDQSTQTPRAVSRDVSMDALYSPRHAHGRHPVRYSETAEQTNSNSSAASSPRILAEQNVKPTFGDVEIDAFTTKEVRQELHAPTPGVIAHAPAVADRAEQPRSASAATTADSATVELQQCAKQQPPHGESNFHLGITEVDEVEKAEIPAPLVTGSVPFALADSLHDDSLAWLPVITKEEFIADHAGPGNVQHCWRQAKQDQANHYDAARESCNEAMTSLQSHSRRSTAEQLPTCGTSGKAHAMPVATDGGEQLKGVLTRDSGVVPAQAAGFEAAQSNEGTAAEPEATLSLITGILDRVRSLREAAAVLHQTVPTLGSTSCSTSVAAQAVISSSKEVTIHGSQAGPLEGAHPAPEQQLQTFPYASQLRFKTPNAEIQLVQQMVTDAGHKAAAGVDSRSAAWVASQRLVQHALAAVLQRAEREETIAQLMADIMAAVLSSQVQEGSAIAQDSPFELSAKHVLTDVSGEATSGDSTSLSVSLSMDTCHSSAYDVHEAELEAQQEADSDGVDAVPMQTPKSETHLKAAPIPANALPSGNMDEALQTPALEYSYSKLYFEGNTTLTEEQVAADMAAATTHPTDTVVSVAKIHPLELSTHAMQALEEGLNEVSSDVDEDELRDQLCDLQVVACDRNPSERFVFVDVLSKGMEPHTHSTFLAGSVRAFKILPRMLLAVAAVAVGAAAIGTYSVHRRRGKTTRK